MKATHSEQSARRGRGARIGEGRRQDRNEGSVSPMSRSSNTVVLSWSGEASGKVALALARFLKLTLQACEPWVSSRNIGAGSFWHEELWTTLRAARIGIVCLTPDNLHSKWIHFEAGVIARAFGQALTCPYLLNVHPHQVEGPLQHLQCVSADEQGTFRLVQEINRSLRSGSLEPEILAAAFEAYWPALNSTLEKISEEEKSRREGRERVELLDAASVNTGGVAHDITVNRVPGEFNDMLMRQMIMQEFVLGILQPNPSREPPALFRLNQYTEDMLLELLKCAKDLEMILSEEIKTRNRLLIPD